MKITLLGTGNTATVLGRKFKKAGHEICQVFGRNKAEAEALAHELQASVATSLQTVSPDADIYMLAVSDDGIAGFAAEWKLKEKMLVHTAGAVSKDVLKDASSRYGVFYPLQSLRKQIPTPPETPICIDAGDAETLNQLKNLANTISAQVFEAGDEQRLKLHLAAVFVNNFVNHIYTQLQDYCSNEKLDFSLLLPLIHETGERLGTLPPVQAQTGPAVRKDQQTIEKHLSLLQSHPELFELYRFFTQSIQQWHEESVR
ncbi:MAG: Rossmann-like and DUF2520 domain-containing protein [Flavisolibacter sp.]